MDTTATDGDPAQARTPGRPRLLRTTEDRVVAGVAGGIGRHLNVDPVLIRIGFVVAVFAGGLGLLLYLAAWLLIPEEGHDEPVGISALGGVRRTPWLGVALLVLGGTLLFGQLFAFRAAVFWGLLLIGFGWLLYREDADKEPPSGGSPPASDPPAATTTAIAPTAPVAPARHRRRRPSYLGRYTFAGTLIVVGFAAMLDNMGAVSLTAGQYPALALVVVGAGLLVGTLWGRARALIVLGIALIPVAWAGALVDVPLRGGFAERFYSPTTTAVLEDEYGLIGGGMRFDLSRLEWGTQPVEIDATVAFGQIEVFVPRGVEVEFKGSVGAGQIEFFRERREGVDLELQRTGGELDGRARLILDARTSFGRIYVTDSHTERMEVQ